MPISVLCVKIGKIEKNWFFLDFLKKLQIFWKKSPIFQRFDPHPIAESLK